MDVNLIRRKSNNSYRGLLPVNMSANGTSSLSHTERNQSMEADERRLVDLLKEVQRVLSDASNSLGNKKPPTIEANYLGRVAARTVIRAADGYILLREAHRRDSSKLLIRPALEAVFSAAAMIKQPRFFGSVAQFVGEWRSVEESLMGAATLHRRGARAKGSPARAPARFSWKSEVGRAGDVQWWLPRAWLPFKGWPAFTR
jgi:hypothetical protein